MRKPQFYASDKRPMEGITYQQAYFTQILNVIGIVFVGWVSVLLSTGDGFLEFSGPLP